MLVTPLAPLGRQPYEGVSLMSCRHPYEGVSLKVPFEAFCRFLSYDEYYGN